MRHRILLVAGVLLLANGCGDDAPEPAADGATTTLAVSATTVTPADPEDAAAIATAERFSSIEPVDPGCSVAVGHEGEVVYAEGFGLADLDEGTPITTSTLFDIASVSKQFTAVAVLLAARDGDLALDDDIRHWVPELPDYGQPPATIEEMLHHQSGLPDYITLLEQEGYTFDEVTTTQDTLDALAAGPGLDFEPGTDWAYSNTGFFLLGVAIERATGLALPQYLQRHVFGPLDLDMIMDPVSPLDGKAVSYDRGVGEWVVADSPWEQVGDGAIQSSPSALVQWADSWSTAPFGDDILTAQLRSVPTGEGTRYGAGIEISRDGGVRRLEHSGGWAGFSTELTVDPERRIAVAVTCNRTDRPGPTSGSTAILELWSDAFA